MREIFAYDRIADQEFELAPLTERERGALLLRSGDLLFARQSLTYEGAGRCVLVMDSAFDRTWESHIMRVRLNQLKACPAYYYYYFRSASGRSAIESIIQQVAAAGIRGSDLRRIQVPVPPVGEQTAIAEVLGALDDKIAANAVLTSTIDKYLYVRFACLIDDCNNFVSLREIGDVNLGAVKPVPGAQLRYVDIASVGVGTFEFPKLSSWDDAPSRARRVLRHGDTLWSTVRPNRRSHALNLCADPDLVGSTGLAILSPRTVGFAYLYELTCRPEFTEYLESVAEGSAYPAVRSERFGDAVVPLVEDAAREAFEIDAAPLRELGASRDAENRKLAETRDALLPQLMSGRIRVKDAARVVGEVL